MSGVYISYPFCAQKCTYCNFASGVFPQELEASYLRRLLDELRETNWPWTPETVYLGGGTPSLWPLDELSEVLAKVPGYPWTEATLECAPGTITAAKAGSWQKLGINRVSLGVQSFVETELRRTGRKHTSEIVENDVKLLREAGIPNVNLDLIAGLAGQTSASWRQSLDCLLELDPPHASIYILEVDEDSRLGAEVLLNGKRFGASDIPSDERQVEFYEEAVARLRTSGILRYEISNFAKPGFESRHNLKYWRLEDYLGFGADAHSNAFGQRWQNVESPTAYAGSDQVQESTEAADPATERYWVGLRLSEGVVDTGEYTAEVTSLERDGLLEKANGRIRLTPRGVLFSNEVFERFLPHANH